MDKINDELKKLELEIEDVKRRLQALPDGSLVCSRNGNYWKWYWNSGDGLSYLPKSARPLAEKLAVRKYLSLLLRSLQARRSFLDSYLARKSQTAEQAVQAFLEDPAYQPLLAPYFTPLSPELAQWAAAPYDQNPLFPEQRIHKCASGHLVRSKSEAIIDMVLYTSRVPFRYECALTLGKTVIYPDFTIRDPSSGKTYYWEHFGMMDQPSYASRTFSKLHLYTSFQIFPAQLPRQVFSWCGSISYKRARGRKNLAILSVFPGRPHFGAPGNWLVFTFPHPYHQNCAKAQASRPVPSFTFPLPVSSKILGKNTCFFPQCPRITGKSWDFTGFFQRIGHILRFTSCIPKNHWNFGHSRKKVHSMPNSEA